MRHPTQIPGRLYRLFTLLILVSMACSLPGMGQSTPTSVPTSAPTSSPTPPPLPLPPALVETDPLPGAALPLTGPITLYFNQPMARASVESALSGDPPLSGSFAWVDDATLTFTPDTPFPPDSSLTLNIASTAQSENGMPMLEPASLFFNTAGHLQMTQALPVPDSAEIDPTSAVVAAFNRPVVPLGAEMASLPAPFSLDPPAAGAGEWINTSTYVFYPQPGLRGGITYTVSIDPALYSADGSPLLEAPAWSFGTAFPRLVSSQPEHGAVYIDLDAAVRLVFNQPMDAASVEANFSLTDGFGQVVAGQAAWNEDFTTFTYTPTLLLDRSMPYTTILGAAAISLGGTPLEEPLEATWWTLPDLMVLSHTPEQNGELSTYQGVVFYLSAPVPQEGLLDFITVSPSVNNLRAYANAEDRSLSLYGSFEPETQYAVTLSASLLDRWGGALRQDYTLKFTTTPLPSRLSLPMYADSYSLTPNSPGIYAEITNLTNIPVSVGSISLSDYMTLMGPDGYYTRQGYQPASPVFWEYSLDRPANTVSSLNLALNADGLPPQPGIYFMRLGLPQDVASTSSVLVSVSNYQLTFKLSTTEAFVWAVDLRNNQPAGLMPVSIYDPNGQLLVNGMTGSDGVFRGALPLPEGPVYGSYYAVMGQPGQENFGLALSTWNLEVTPWSFNIPFDADYPGLQAYLYTDRPIYRPGQTVYFRAVVRQAYNGRYTLPEAAEFPLTLYDNQGQVQAAFNLGLNAFGTGQGEYRLPENLQPGYYRLGNDETGNSITIQVAEYRKPEINLGVAFRETDLRAGQSAVADVDARYFFDAPAGNLTVHWALYARTDYFAVPDGYQVGAYDAGWLNGYRYYGYGQSLGELITQGDAQTAPDGTLVLELATETEEALRQYTLEVTITDESGFPVSARASLWAHPADHYIAVRPDAYAVRAGEEAGFDVFSVGWDAQASGERSLQASFSAVTWVLLKDPNYPYDRYVPEYKVLASSDFATGADGLARLAFVPEQPGTYMLQVTGDGARTQVMIWVGGPGAVVWPTLPNQRIELTPDRASYLPGDVAQLFVPNPFSRASIALLTIERDTVLRYQVLVLEPGGSTVPISLGEDDAPNVYVSVTILYSSDRSAVWEQPDFRQGYVELIVEPVQQTLNVEVTSQPERAGPRDTVTLSIRITDADGNLVQGEFSLAAVDLAVLALAEPNAPDILDAFYGEQPLGVRTGLSLAADGQRMADIAGGIGGGGDEGAAPMLREDFPDTAFWNGQIITGPDGTATVTFTLPDSLTTWQIDVRGVTQDTRVGQATVQIVTTKELLIRPVAPRFLVAGDHLPLAAVVQNNTLSQVQATVSLQAAGFELDDPSLAAQTVTVPASGRVRVEWWGTAQDVPSADLIFTVEAGSLQDAVRLAEGALPVLRYSAPQTFATAGHLAEGGQRLELISLPMSFDASSGALRLELAPSLAAAMLDALEVLEQYPYECTEQTLSRFLPNLETYRMLQAFGIPAPDLQARLERTLDDGLQTLLERQNDDGGWAWWPGGDSDPYISAYILFGLARAQQTGLSVPDEAFQNAAAYLVANLVTPEQTSDAALLDRSVFTHFALAQAGFGDPTGAGQLYGVRDQLSPWAKALLALTIEQLSPGSEQVRTLLSDLQSTAGRSATGVFWQAPHGDWRNMTTTLSGSAMAIYALAQLEPASTLLPDAVRFLMAGRGADGAWASTYESAWAVLALTEYMKGTGELGGDFPFSATLNGVQIASGQASLGTPLTPVQVETPISSLYPNSPNALAILRQAGTGLLYYTVALDVYRPVETVTPLERGLSISRSYTLDSAQAGQSLTVRLTLVAPNDAYHLVVEDYIPAGAEILDTSLLTSQLGETTPEEAQPLYDPRRPFESGWGWWLFQQPMVYDDHIAWAVEYLPAGTYELTYTLVLTQPGQYHVLPARAYLFYFPEVQGTSAGMLFEIEPRP